jgi:hypothetical protein
VIIQISEAKGSPPKKKELHKTIKWKNLMIWVVQMKIKNISL